MPMISQNGLNYFEFKTFPQELVFQRIYSRTGGVSPQPWDSLNLGGTVGDERNHVVENRQRIFENAGRPVSTIYDVWQVHSAEVVCTDIPRPLDQEPVKADAIITSNPAVTLFMRFADCVPILLFDPVKKVAGLVHSGWMGTVQRISKFTIEKMVSEFGCRPEDILAGIGPSIGPDHYEVGENVIDQVKETFSYAPEVLIYKGNSCYLDLWKLNERILRDSGVKSIEQSLLCTACDRRHWYSHRAEHGKTGRFGALIYLRDGNQND
jgi:YfiH family protein